MPTNIKNNSSSIRSIFGGAAGGGNPDHSDIMRAENDSNRYYEGMLPNLNVTKKECKLLSFIYLSRT